MRNLATVAVVALIVPAPVLAEHPPAVACLAYTFVAPGGVSGAGPSLHIGGGFDVVATKVGFGASIEAGYLGELPGRFGSGMGVVSAGGIQHFRLAKNPLQAPRLTPFLTAGYSLAFRDLYMRDAIYAGAGLNYWFGNWGLRFEFRDHMPLYDFGENHMWGLRVGFSWGL